MTATPEEPSAYTPTERNTTRQIIINFVNEECTFYRVHLTGFILIPLVASGIFYASNGEFYVEYLDALFLCYSSMTVTGLTTVNLSTLTPWQQVMLYFLMIIGDITTISWIVVLVRKRFFRNHCEYIMAEIKHKRQRPLRSRSELLRSIAAPRWIPYNPKSKDDLQSVPVDPTIDVPSQNTAHFDDEIQGTPDIASGVSAPPLIPSTTVTRPTPQSSALFMDPDPEAQELDQLPPSSMATAGFPNRRQSREVEDGLVLDREGLFSGDGDDGGYGARWRSSPIQAGLSLPVNEESSPKVEFALSTGVYPAMRDEGIYRAFGSFGAGDDRRPPPRRILTLTTSTLNQRRTTPTLPGTLHPTPHTTGPFAIMQSLAKRAAPKAYKKLERTLTMPSSRTLEGRNTSYLDFDLKTERNSDFHTETLSEGELEMLGGTEYRALRWLTFVVPLYFIGTQILAFTIFAPWISTTKQYDGVFEEQPRLVNKTWFSLFQVMGAYTGGGLSLVDLGMIPFQQAYLMIFPMMFVILAGNHAMPVFMRLVIWILSMIVREDSDTHAALSFLLDHPRRCFLYLFPSHQTWFLLFSLFFLSAIEWICFAVLNDGLPVYDELPVGVHVVGGLFQGIAARASGFSIVPLSSFAPSLLFLYVVMMYIAVYPIAMSIRSTNVYEERSLGVYEIQPYDEYNEPQGLEKIKDGRERIGKYLYWHFRRQMSIDIWWLVWGVFFIAVVERKNLMDEDKKWFDMFRVIFELVSAFGGIGLSLGFPDDNFSFAGAMRPLSKLIIIVIMVRGRHRGLPVAVDRAIVLPREMVTRSSQSQRTNLRASVDEKTTTQEPQPIYSDFGT